MLASAGIERFTIAHDRGSSHGLSRIIRMAYWEHPDYVPLLRRAYELWRQLEAETHMVRFCPHSPFQCIPAYLASGTLRKVSSSCSIQLLQHRGRAAQ